MKTFNKILFDQLYREGFIDKYGLSLTPASTSEDQGNFLSETINYTINTSGKNDDEIFGNFQKNLYIIIEASLMEFFNDHRGDLTPIVVKTDPNIDVTKYSMASQFDTFTIFQDPETRPKVFKPSSNTPYGHLIVNTFDYQMIHLHLTTWAE